MRVGDLMDQLTRFPRDYNARAYEGEVCGVIVETQEGKFVTCIEAHESDSYTAEVREAKYSK